MAMNWILILTIFTHSHHVAYGPIQIASAPTQQACERLKHSIKKQPINSQYTCVRGY